MNKKVIIFVAFMVFLFIVMVAGYEVTHKEMKTVTSKACIDGYESFDELYNDADVVVIAKVRGNRENVVYGDGLGQDGYTLTEIEIKSILKNNESHKLNVKDKIKMTEPYHIMKGSMFKPNTKCIFGGYTELKDDYMYVLALAWNDESNTYSTKGVYQCKYNIDCKDKDELETWDIKDDYLRHSQEPENIVQKLRQGLFEKYSAEIKEVLKNN